MEKESRKGMLCGAGAYLWWGLVPLYFKALAGVTPLEVLAHRILWSVLLLLAVLLLSGGLGSAWALLRRPRLTFGLLGSASLISVNWLLYIWAVANGHTLEASFGYFLNPILMIALGVLFLKERLSRGQVLSLIFAATGVVCQLFDLGGLPWLGLVLASSFGLYGLVRKRLDVGSVDGLFVETSLLSLPSLGYLAWLLGQGRLAFLHQGLALDGLLVAAGLVTAVPLVLFASGARRLPLSMMGFLQYISPTMQFAIAVLVFHEPLSAGKLVGFALVWAGLLVLILERQLGRRRLGAIPVG